MRATVFGGTGFLGARIAAQLLQHGATVRIAARHPERFRTPERDADRVEPVRVDMLDPPSMDKALDGADAVINAVSLYVEKGDATFHRIHVEGARQLAERARRKGIDRLVQLSGIGSDARSSSKYIRKRGEGENAVRAAHERATIFRPSVMFGSNDGFINMLASLSRQLPVLPLFGNGETKLQPVCVGDVAAAAAHAAVNQPEAQGTVYELGGPDIWSYRNLLASVMQATGRKRPLVPVPFFVWDSITATASLLPNPPITEGQVALMKRDNITSTDYPGLAALGVSPVGIRPFLDEQAAKA